MLAIAQSPRDEDMIELFEVNNPRVGNVLWGVFHRDVLYQEPEDTYKEIAACPQLEVVIVPRDRYEALIALEQAQVDR
jgi:hypothetical protein